MGKDACGHTGNKTASLTNDAGQRGRLCAEEHKEISIYRLHNI